MRLVEFLFRSIGSCVTCLGMSSAKDDVAVEESVLLEMRVSRLAGGGGICPYRFQRAALLD